jgi:hypothetical protein
LDGSDAAAASAPLHAALLEAIDRGVTHLGSFLGAQRPG